MRSLLVSSLRWVVDSAGSSHHSGDGLQETPSTPNQLLWGHGGTSVSEGWGSGSQVRHTRCWARGTPRSSHSVLTKNIVERAASVPVALTCPRLPGDSACVRAHACCSHIARDQDGPVELPPDCPSPMRAIGAPESPLCFQKQKISFTINILLRRLINSSRSLRGTGQWLRGQSSRHSCSGRGRPLGFLRTAVVSCVPPVCL